MSADDGFVASVIGALATALEPLADARDAGQLGALLGRVGWRRGPGDDVASSFAATATAVGRLADAADAGAEAAELVARVADAISALAALRDVTASGPPFDDPEFWIALP